MKMCREFIVALWFGKENRRSVDNKIPKDVQLSKHATRNR